MSVSSVATKEMIVATKEMSRTLEPVEGYTLAVPGALFCPNDGKLGTTKQGALQCDTPDHRGASWCMHMENAVKAHADAMLIWSGPSELEGVEIEVPMIPSKDQWATVQFAGRSETLGAYKAYYRRDFQDKNVGLDELEFLGFVHPGEGRQVLRTMLHDWLQMHIALDKIECPNPTHSFKAQMAWERNTTEGTNTALAEYWSVIDTGKCLTCDKIGGDDFSDLVPESGGKKW